MVELSQIENTFLYLMSHCCRMITVEQHSRLFGISVNTSHRQLMNLCELRLVHCLTTWSSSVPVISKPLAIWSVGEPEPNFGEIAYQAQQRWKDRPIRKEQVYVASDKTLRLFALPKRPKLKLVQATHDLGVTEMYLWCLQRWPRLTERGFIGEDIYSNDRGHGEKCEDAQLVLDGHVLALLEYAGSYRRDRLNAFHDHARNRGTRYLLF